MTEERSPEGLALAALAPLVLPALMKELGGGEWKTQLRDFFRRDPLDANISFVLGATAAFYVAEKDDNPAVSTILDALTFVATCMSVGYAEIHAKTQTGKLIASIVMTVGPALSMSLLNAPASPPPADLQPAILERLDDILAELRRQSSSPSPVPTGIQSQP